MNWTVSKNTAIICKGTLNQTIKNGTATCFFIKLQGEIVLVSNYHVFSLQDINDSSIVNPYNIDFFVMEELCRSDGCPSFKVATDSPYINYFKKPDLYFYPVKMEMFPKVNTIENFSYKLPKNAMVIRAFCFGYPVGKDETLFFSNTTIVPLDTSFIFRTHNKELFRDSIYYNIESEIEPGMSGSPVFIEYHLPNSTKLHFIFAGVASRFGENAYGKYSVIVKPSVFYKEINAYLSRLHLKK